MKGDPPRIHRALRVEGLCDFVARATTQQILNSDKRKSSPGELIKELEDDSANFLEQKEHGQRISDCLSGLWPVTDLLLFFIHAIPTWAIKRTFNLTSERVTV